MAEKRQRVTTLITKKAAEEAMAAKLQRSLPDDIIFNEILIRLPVKPLLQFTRVSKSWKAPPSYTPTIIIIGSSTKPHHVFISFTCQILSGIQCRNPPLTENSLSCRVRIIGSSEGLICFLKESTLYLWNPFVRTMKRIPAGEIPISKNNMYFDMAPQSRKTILGFGYSGGVHRVVKLLWEENYSSGEVEIYSLSADSWRRIVPPSGLEKRGFRGMPHFYWFHRSIVTFKGSIYWLGFWKAPNEHNPVYKMVRFDLDKELFEEIEAPRSSKLVVNGCLVLLHFVWASSKAFRVVAYVKKELELGSSFSKSKSFCFNFRKDAADTVYYDKITTSGHIILARKDGSLFSYDCYVEDNNLGFKLRDTGIKFRLHNFNFIPIQETLVLLDKNISD